MKLIPKYQEGRKVYQYRRYGDLNTPANAEVLDEAGLKVSPNEDTPILTNEDGVPINRNWLVANGYYSQTPSGDIINNTPLNEVVKVASKDYPALDFYRTESGTYRIPFHDSFINANSAEEAIKLLQKAKSEYSDPSENFLNDAMAGGAALTRTGLTGAASLLKDTGKSILRTGKDAVLFPIKHPYRFAFDTALGAGIDYLTNLKVFNGKSLVDVTSEKTGLPDWAVNAGFGIGGGMLSDKIASPFRPYTQAYLNVLKNPKYVAHKDLKSTFRSMVKEEPSSSGRYVGPADDGFDSYPILIMQKDDSQLAYRFNPDAVGFEIHLGGKTRPGAVGKRFAYRQLEGLPSGSYISSNSLTPSLEGLMQERGFWKTFFSKDHNIFSGNRPVDDNVLPLTENSYELLLNTAKKYPNKFRLDFAHKTRYPLHVFPKTVDASKPFYKLYHDALNTGDLTELNNYLKTMNAPKATFNKSGNIELSLPVLYKKRFGGKLN